MPQKIENKDIFRPFPKTKKITKNNCYFSGYFATVPYFGVIHKDAFFYKNKFIKLSRTHPLEPDTIHGEGWVKNWKVKQQTKTAVELMYVHQGKNSFPHKYQAWQRFSLKKTENLRSEKEKRNIFIRLKPRPRVERERERKKETRTEKHVLPDLQ